ncbi:MAG: HupE/UreJ family protein [Arenicellales bacterium]
MLFGLIIGGHCVVTQAHEVRPAIVDLYLKPAGYKLEINLNLEAVLAGIGPEHSDTKDSINSLLYDRLRALSPRDLHQEFNNRQSEFLSAILINDTLNNRITHQIEGIEIAEVGDTDLARDSTITLSPEFNGAIEGITWSWSKEYGSSVIRINHYDPQQQQDAYSAFISSGKRSVEIPLSGEISLKIVDVAWNYLVTGFIHILPRGLDHILFVVGLFLLSPLFRPLLIQVSCFTVAHTMTLALAASGLLYVPAAIVEPLIAASIIYVAVENITSEKLKLWRPFLVFGFGLLHGLGFAGVLSDVGISNDYFILALVAFNIGVEAGQIAVIFGCFMLVGFWFRHRNWYRAVITIPASLLIAIVGGFWFVQRVIG